MLTGVVPTVASDLFIAAIGRMQGVTHVRKFKRPSIPKNAPKPAAIPEPEMPASKQSQPPTDQELCARLLATFGKVNAGLLDRIKAESCLGQDWVDIKRTLKDAKWTCSKCTFRSKTALCRTCKIKCNKGMTIKRWLLCNKLPFSHTYANGCARLAQAYAKFQAAHGWYLQTGISAGWRVRKNSGWEYAQDVIALQETAQNGNKPEADGTRKTPNKASKRSASQRSQKMQADSIQRECHLIDALEEVTELFGRTAEGTGYVNRTLEAAKLQRAQQAAAQAGEQTNAADAQASDTQPDEVDNDPVETTRTRTQTTTALIFDHAA